MKKCSLDFTCPTCGCKNFTYTVYCPIKKTRHGAVCAMCKSMVTAASFIRSDRKAAMAVR